MPQLHSETFATALRRSAGYDLVPGGIGERLSAVPPIEALADLPVGTPVWIRADLDVADRDGVIGDDPRLASLRETLDFGRKHGWRMLLIGHRGRAPDLSLEYVHQKLKATEAGCGPFIRDWFDEHAETLTGAAVKGVESLRPGQFLVFENLRRYDFEMRLWHSVEGQLPAITDHFARVAGAFRQGATVYVNDAISAGNKDFSSAALPLAMGRVALGVFARRELEEHVTRARQAGLVCFSGMKLDKLANLHGIVRRGHVELILAGGSLAMALRQARGERDGVELSIGAAGDPSNKEEKAYVPRSAVERANQLLADAERRGIRVVLPVDFVVEDGRVTEEIGPEQWQRDIGPRTRELFDREARAWAAKTERRVAFHNGVMGQFENNQFAGGTRAIVATLKALAGSGIEVYVGGGEGRAALQRFGSVQDVTHAFTAGGTVLKCLADDPLPFLEALAAQAATVAD